MVGRRLVVLALVLGASLGAGCADDGDAGPDADGSDAAAVDDEGACTQGRAWPDDADFRVAVCESYAALDAFAGDEVSDVREWTRRITDAIIAYPDDRGAALAELEAVTAAIDAAS